MIFEKLNHIWCQVGLPRRTNPSLRRFADLASSSFLASLSLSVGNPSYSSYSIFVSACVYMLLDFLASLSLGKPSSLLRACICFWIRVGSGGLEWNSGTTLIELFIVGGFLLKLQSIECLRSVRWNISMWLYFCYAASIVRFVFQKAHNQQFHRQVEF